MLPVKESQQQYNNTTGISYTDDQDYAINSTIKWFRTSKEPMFVLKGPAGSGKTTILREIVSNLRTTIACSAPTHRAVRQIRNSVGAKAYTIHKLLGLYPNLTLENFDHNNPIFDPRGKQYITEYKLVIIDEASMITDKMDKYLYRLASDNGVKILYVGDPFQLPPVDPTNNYVNTIPAFLHKGVELTTIVRQEEGHPILENIRLLRNDVKYKQNNFLRKIYKEANKRIFIEDAGYFPVTNRNHYNNLVYDVFSEPEYLTNINFVKHLSFTNADMISYNKYIRSRIVNSMEDVLLCKDDLLLAYSSILDEFNSLIITNSDNYIVYNNELTHFTKDGISGYLVKLQNVEDGEISKLLFIVDTYNEEALNTYMITFNRLLRAAKLANNPTNRKEAWKAFYAFKNDFLLLENIIYNNSIITSTDFNYGHSITVHKAQGSTYEHACINLRDIVYTSTNVPRANIDIRNRLLYVALSRVRKSAILYI